MAMADEDRRSITYWADVEYTDDSKPLTLSFANLLREYADWLESVGPYAVGGTGNIGLPSGSIKWRRTTP